MSRLKSVLVTVLACAVCLVGCKTQDPPLPRDKPRHQCEKCGNEFEIDLDKQLPEPQPDMTESMKLPDCPVCGAMESGQIMVRCPQCERSYVSVAAKSARQMMLDEDWSAQNLARDICPHCGTDRVEWYMKERDRRRAREKARDGRPSP